VQEVELLRRTEEDSSEYLEVTTTAPCPVNCLQYCPQKLLREVYSGPALLSMQNFKRVLEHVDSDVGICFSGYGEPFLNPQCTDMILEAHRRGHFILVFSTLSNIRLDDWRRIEHIPFRNFCVHLPDKNGITKVRITPDYLAVLESLVSKPYSSFMAMAELVERVAKIVSPVFSYGETFHFVNNERAGNLGNRTKRTYHGHVNCKKLNDPQYVMLPDGTVTLCCQDWALKHKLANLLEEDFHDVYKSEEMQRVLKSARSFTDSYALCRGCVGADTAFMRIERATKNAFIESLKDLGVHPLAKKIYAAARF